MSLAVVLTIAVLLGAIAGTRVRVPGWMPVLALAAAVAAYVLGFFLGYEDDNPRGGDSAFWAGVVVGWVMILVAIVATAAVIAGAVSRRR